MYLLQYLENHGFEDIEIDTTFKKSVLWLNRLKAGVKQGFLQYRNFHIL